MEVKQTTTVMKDSHVALSSSPTKKLTTTFCNPSVFRCIDYFVLLPKSPKVTLARRSSFAASLWQRLKRHAADVVADGSDSRRLDAAVYRAELLYPDYVGRLVQKTPSGGGVKRWCVLSDILFCVFVSERAERANDVILLPGNTVKSLIFRTASLYTAKSKRGGGNGGGGGGGGWGTSKTLDDLDMFQFMIENEATGEKFKFSTANQLELDKWVSLLKIASCLDPTIVPPDDATSGDVNGDPMDPYQRATVPVPSDYYGDLSDQALYGDCSTLASLLPSTPARGQQQQQRDEYSADDSVGDEIRTPLGDRDAVRDSNRALAESGGAPARHGKKSITFSDVIAGGARTTDASRHAARAGGGGSSGSGAGKHAVSREPSRNAGISSSCSGNTSNVGSSGNTINSSSSGHTINSSSSSSSSSGGNNINISGSSGNNINNSSSSGNNNSSSGGGCSSSGVSALAASIGVSGVRSRHVRDMEICEYLYYKQATGWTKMYCALRDGSCTVWRTSDTGQPPLVFLDLRGCAATLADDEQQVGSAFRLTLPNRYTFLFAPPSNLDMERWLSVLRHNGCEITDDDDATTTTATVTLRRATTVTQSAFYAEMTGGGDAAESATVEAFCTAPRRRRAPRDAAATQTLTQPWFNGDVRPRTVSDASDDGPPAERSALCTVPEVRIRKMSAASSTSCESAPPTLLVERSRIGETSDRLHPRLALRSTSCSPPRERKSHLVQHSRSMDHFDDDSVAAAVAAEEEEEHERWGRELLLLKRDQLLQEVLRQKAELEARQQHKPQVTEADINIKYERAQTEEDLKILRDITQLRQRRISTVLRVESLQKSLKKSSKKIGGSGGSGKGRLVTMGSSEELKTRLVEMTDEVTRINDEIATREHRREVAQHKLSTQRVEELQRFSASMKRRDAPSRPSGGAAGNRCDTPSPPVATGGVAAAVTTVAPPRGASPKPAERAKKGAKYGPLKIVTNIAEFRLRSSDSKKKNKQQRKHEVAQRALDVISGSTTSLDAVDAGPKASPDSADARLSSPELVAPPVDAKACESARGVSSFETEVMAMLQRTKTSSVSSRDGSTSSGHSRRLTADEALLKPETIAVITEFESYIDDYLKQTDSVENVAL